MDIKGNSTPTPFWARCLGPRQVMSLKRLGISRGWMYLGYGRAGLTLIIINTMPVELIVSSEWRSKLMNEGNELWF